MEEANLGVIAPSPRATASLKGAFHLISWTSLTKLKARRIPSVLLRSLGDLILAICIRRTKELWKFSVGIPAKVGIVKDTRLDSHDPRPYGLLGDRVMKIVA